MVDYFLGIFGCFVCDDVVGCGIGGYRVVDCDVCVMVCVCVFFCCEYVFWFFCLVLWFCDWIDGVGELDLVCLVCDDYCLGCFFVVGVGWLGYGGGWVCCYCVCCVGCLYLFYFLLIE